MRSRDPQGCGSAKTEVPADAPATAVLAPLRDVGTGLLWAIVHTPEDVVPCLAQLEPADLEGLRSQDLLEKALDLSCLRARR